MHPKGTRKELDTLLETAWEGQHKRQKWAEAHPPMPDKHKPKPKGFGLERSDVIAICVGVIVAIVIYLEPQKTPTVVVACLLILASCVVYLLVHWFGRWPWVTNAGTKQRRARLVVAVMVMVALAVLYVRHVWPREDPMQKKIEQVLLGQEYDPAKLSSQFPIGYVVFKLEYTNKVEFYKGLSLIENYDFNWSTVKYTANTENTFELKMPDIIERGGIKVYGNTVGGPKRVGWFLTYYTAREFKAVCEVLDTDKDGIVFLVGLMPSH